jgi:hypothetical protein
MRAELPARLAGGPCVIKRNRGSGGQGVWKVETLAGPRNRPTVRAGCRQRSCRCKSFYFEDGCVIDQPLQARLTEGVVRCYMAGDSLRRLRPPEGQGTRRLTGRARRGRTRGAVSACRAPRTK